MNNFNISIKNMGIINEADLNIGLINVIGGRNATGKSISSKLLFCLLTSISRHGVLIDNNSLKQIYLDIIDYCKNLNIINSDNDLSIN